MYEAPGNVVATFGPVRIVAEHAGDREYSMWGPDLAGRDCRMGRYLDTGSAFAAARVIAFSALCKAHDLTFEYSDDSRVYNRGREQLDAIRTAARELPPGVAATIWNQTVSEKILPQYAAQYSWKGDA